MTNILVSVAEITAIVVSYIIGMWVGHKLVE